MQGRQQKHGHQSAIERPIDAGLPAMCLLLSEAISLHARDKVLYRRIGPRLTIGWPWSLLAGTTMVLAGTVGAQKG